MWTAVIRSWLPTVVCILLALCVILLGAIHDIEQRIVRQNIVIENIHVRFVQACELGSEEPHDECEARWAKAVVP